jgi:hypothetical protein
VIDFDDCGFSRLFSDFADAVSFMEHEPVVAELQASWLDGYHAIAPVSHEDELMLTIFVMEPCDSAAPRSGASPPRTIPGTSTSSQFPISANDISNFTSVSRNAKLRL